MKKYVLSDDNVNNIIAFLNRVEFKGLPEASAAIEIVNALNNPIVEDKDQNPRKEA